MFVESNGRPAAFTDRKLLSRSDANGTDSEEPHVGEVADIRIHTTSGFTPPYLRMSEEASGSGL